MKRRFEKVKSTLENTVLIIFAIYAIIICVFVISENKIRNEERKQVVYIAKEENYNAQSIVKDKTVKDIEPMAIIMEDVENVKTEPEFYLSDYERWVVECIVAGEAIGEPYDGQVAVAQCVLNACLKDGIQPSEVKTRYKYSGWNESPSDSVRDAVKAVFDNGYKITDEFILYFYAPKYSKGGWHETQNFVIEIGGHRFFSLKNK